MPILEQTEDQERIPPRPTKKGIDPAAPESKPGQGEGVKIPLTIIRWLTYSLIMFGFLLPFPLTILQVTSGALILGHFAGVLNAINQKK